MNEAQLDQLCTTEVRLKDDRSGSKDQRTNELMNQQPDDINSKVNKDQDKENNDEEEEDDHKPSAQEKSQDGDDEDISDSDEDKPSRKKRRKESFSLGCEVLHQYIEFDDGHPVFFDKLKKLQREAQEAQERLVELDALRREYQWTVSAYEDLYQ